VHLSHQRLKILREFYEGQPREFSGADIMRLTRLGSGSAYPILVVFEERGILQSRWESETAEALGRPRRRLYKLTGLGAEVYRSAVADIVPSGFVMPTPRPSEA
jgi:PadR family transcriptional regulator PadR